MNTILTQAQAEAVYSAMCTLNNVSGRAHHIDLPIDGDERASIVARTDGGVMVWQARKGVVHHDELYASQLEFAKAYGLQHG